MLGAAIVPLVTASTTGQAQSRAVSPAPSMAVAHRATSDSQSALVKQVLRAVS